MALGQAQGRGLEEGVGEVWKKVLENSGVSVTVGCS